jgi:hypothetical protein
VNDPALLILASLADGEKHGYAGDPTATAKSPANMTTPI